MEDLDLLPATPLGRYRHYKGGEYEVLGVVRHSETLEPLVLSRPLAAGRGDWVRPHAMFFSDVEIDGIRQPRFAPMPQAEPEAGRSASCHRPEAKSAPAKRRRSARPCRPPV